MKRLHKVALLGVLALTLLGASACSNKQTGSSSSKIPTKITKKTNVTFWYSLTGTAQASLKKLTSDFEKKNPNITIKLQSQGGNYDDLQAKINSSLQSPQNLPTITQSYSDWLYTAAQNKMLTNLTPYITNKKIGWGSYQNSPIQAGLWNGAKINGIQYGVPFNKSVEVLFYNKTLMNKYNIKVPKTMAELKTASKQIYQKSNHKVRGMGFDSLNNYYMLAMKENGINFNKKLNFTSPLSKKVINYYADGVKDGYFMQAGTEKYMSTPFSNARVAMFIGSTANEAYVKQGLSKKYQYGVAARPSKVNIQQGTDLYVFNKASASQKAAAFMYLKFLAGHAPQLYWTQKTGYMPVNTQVLNSAAYKANKDSKVPAILAQTAKNLYFLPAVNNSNSAYNQINSNMQLILAQASKKGNWNNAVKVGKSKLDSSWKQ